ncbi:MAG: hypothetical protein RL528_884 [Bacteroidota bacterium]
MKKLKTFLVWLIFGYDNRPIRTYLEHNRNILIILGLRLHENSDNTFDISSFSLILLAVSYLLKLNFVGNLPCYQEYILQLHLHQMLQFF